MTFSALDRHSERFSATGSIAAEGVKNQLGRPHLSRLAVLVREAVQNSWDARAQEAGGITFGISSWMAEPDQRLLLRNVVFASTPPKLELASCLAEESVRLLAVYDRGTNGLAGPTRADIAPEPGEPTDFVDFLRNIGQPPDRDFGGGTYGFGKAAFYLASRARTIIVHTHCLTEGRPESRLIAAALGSQYEEKDQTRFTGRHWWGRLSESIADPLTGPEADELAQGLGLPLFGESRGTTIVLVEPDFEGASGESAIEGMRDVVLRYFWPKFLDGNSGGGSIQFELSLDGNRIEVPHPQQVPELAGLVQAFRGLDDAAAVENSIFGGQFQPVECQRPRKRLGGLALVRFPASEKRVWSGGESQTEVPIGEPFGRPAHHVALLRTPNFVVRYMEGPSTPSARIEYAGVFRAEREADPAFAMAEPPTHDDWVPDALDNGPEKTFVRVALRRIKEAVREFAAPPTSRDTVGLDLPLGALSDQLGELVPSEQGTGARQQESQEPGQTPGRPGGSSRGGGSGHRGRVRVLDETEIVLVHGRPALVVPFEVQHGGGEPLTVRAECGVLLEGGGIETDPPAGAEHAMVLEWRAPDGNRFGAIAECQIPAQLGGRWSVIVAIPPDAMISVGVSIIRTQAD